MGRGLSELQKTILKIVNDNATESINTNDFGENPVRVSEIAEAYYGWKSTKKIVAYRERSIFDKKNIEGYNAGKVAISKAMKRLEARGLIEQTSRGGRGWVASTKLLSRIPKWQEIVKVRHHQRITEMPRHQARYMLTWEDTEIVESNG